MEEDHADPGCAGQLHHVELYSSRLESSCQFWDWLLGELGYERKNSFEDGYSWEKGPTYIVLAAASEDDTFDRQTPGLNHIAFHASSREQVDELTAGVERREDSTVLYRDQHPYAGGYYALYCENLDGVKLEVVGPP